MAEPVTMATDADAPVVLNPATHDFLKALASPTRQRIMMLFFNGAELSVGEVAERAGIGQSTASEQLTLMRRGGVVTARRDGKVIRYRGDREGIRKALADLQAYLEVCC
ncbi:ArsR/SmtB family transcription factor [Phytoactinopolyspora limicola]|uniref:ArsR/SmtB family transcription factor n=1 Tax=Phytoactinopolyspora limicola TaxID=2715536 RepID=UPI001A9CA279|nr:metalloregulator ArsR/SmtB family transcription factor [Phytoactinopolyspora limicola]